MDDEYTLGDLVQCVGALLADRGSRVLLGITGPPGAGKSTLAEALIRELGAEAALVPMDGFHLARSQLLAQGRAEVRGAPQTFDTTGFSNVLMRLRPADAGIVSVPDSRREIGEPIAGAVLVGPDVRIVVVEGNYLLRGTGEWPTVTRQLDATWFLDPPVGLRSERLVRRHRMYGCSWDEAQRWVETVDEPNAELIAGDRHAASLIIGSWRREWNLLVA